MPTQENSPEEYLKKLKARIKERTQARIRRKIEVPKTSTSSLKEPQEEETEEQEEETEEQEEGEEQLKERKERGKEEKGGREGEKEEEEKGGREGEKEKAEEAGEGAEETKGAPEEALGEETGGEAAAGEAAGGEAAAGEAAAAEAAAGEAAAAAAGDAAAASAAAGEAAAAAAVATAPEWVPVVIVIAILVIVIVVIVALVFAIFKRGGRYTPQTPNYDSAEDLKDAGEVLGASQNEDASLIGKEAAVSVQSNVQAIANYFKQPNIAFAEDENTKIAKEKAQLLKTNVETFLYGKPHFKKYIKSKIEENISLAGEIKKLLPPDSAAAKQAEETEKKLKSIIENRKALKLEKPILYINPADLELIEAAKIDKRVIKVLAKLVEFYSSLKGEERERYSRFEIKRISQLNPFAIDETPLEEKDQFVSPHYTGQAIDITIVGNYKCEVESATGSKTIWLPCYVAYQEEISSLPITSQSLNYYSLGTALAFRGASNINLSELKKSRSLWDIFSEVGEQTLIKKIGIPDSYWNPKSIFSPEKIIISYFSQKTSLPPQAIEGFLATGDKNSLARGIIESKINLPAGSLEGNSWDEIFINTYKNYIRESLGLSGTGLNNFLDNYDLGIALLKKQFGLIEKDKIFANINRSNIYYQNLWHLDKNTIDSLITSQNLDKLAEYIGEKFKKDFIHIGTPNYLRHWLGLPSGDPNSRDYQIKAGRYIFAKALYLPNPDEAFNSRDYFFKRAPTSPLGLLNLCGDSLSCPLYTFFGNPQSFINELEKQIDEKLYTKINFGSSIGTYLNKYIDTKTLTLLKLKEILKDKDKKQALNSALASYVSTILKNDLLIQTELPGLPESINDQNWGFALKILGANKIALDSLLPPNTLEKITLPNISINDVLKEIAAYKILEISGTSPWSIDEGTLKNDWYKDPEYFTDIAKLYWLKNYGIDVLSIDERGGYLKFDIKTLDDLIRYLQSDEPNDNQIPSSIASFFGLSSEQMALILASAKSGNLRAQSQVLQKISENLNISLDSVIALFSGNKNFDAWLTDLWASEMNEKFKKQSLYFGNENLNLNEVLKALAEKNMGSFNYSLLEIGRGELADVFGLKPEDIGLIFNDQRNFGLESKTLQNSAILKMLSSFTTNKATLDYLAGLYNQYLEGKGNEKELSSAIASVLGINLKDAEGFSKNQIESAFITLISSQISKENREILGEKGISYEEVKKIFLGNESNLLPNESDIRKFLEEQQQIRKGALEKLIYSATDALLLKIDPNLPIGISQIIARGNFEEEKNLLLQWISNRANVPLEKILVIKDFINEGQNIQNLNWETIASQIPSINKYTSEYNRLKETWSELQEYAKEFDIKSPTSAFQTLIESKTQIPISQIANLKQTLDSLNNIANLAQNLKTINLLTGTLQNPLGILNMAGIPLDIKDMAMLLGGANALNFVSGIITGKILDLGLGGFLGGGMKCEDKKEAARKQIRTTIKQVLEVEPYPPLQIITLRKEDVNYFSGLTDEGDISEESLDILTEKYGKAETRGQKGMFFSPLMWDHIHFGY